MKQLISKDKKQPLPILQDLFPSKTQIAIFLVHLCGSDKETNADLHLDNRMTIPEGDKKVRGEKEKRKINTSFSAFLYRDSDVC